MIPRVYKRIPGADFSMQPAKSIRDFKYTEINEDAGYTNRQGLYHFQLTPIESVEAQNDPVNDDGSYKHIVWHSIKHQYYSNFTKEHPHSKTYRYLSEQVDLIATPFIYTGEMIKPGSIRLHNEEYDFDIIDDGNGNLYKSIRASTIASFYDNYKSTCEWDFSTLYAACRGYTSNYGRDLLNSTYIYKNTSDLSAKSNYVSCQLTHSLANNTKFTGISLDNNSYVRTPHIPNLNFIEGEFLIQFKIFIDNPAGSLTEIIADIISVDQVRVIKKKGLQVLSDDKGQYQREMIYESEDTTRADQYPFKFTMTYDGGLKITFKRSDSQKTTTINATITNANELDVQVYRFVANNLHKIAMYINGQLIQVVTDETKYTFNDYDLVFGNTNGSVPFMLGDVKFYNRIPYESQNQLNQLASDLNKDENYYGGYVGNAFYRNGNIIFTPRLTSDYHYFENISRFEYSGIYTMYEYEAVCRVSKGEFNITYNPTARVSPKSDILISDFQNGTLSPYFTTIGLFNEKGDLLVIGKSSQPIQVRDDVDINLIVNWTA